jgi:eukaryotic-like serine/threonine-protein kinase
MGVVYKAQDTKLDRTVALKFLPPHLHLDDEAEQRFISEAKAASSFDHPNICTIYEIDKTDDDQLFIAMACYEGETLKKKLENGSLSIDETVEYSIQIASGLERAHEAGITHRDIKPANIIITNRGEVKILDFGLAKTLSDPGVTKIGSTVGTASYMSPEQAKGTEVNHQSDIWSLGVVMHQMITGKLPFEGDYEQAVIYSILNEEPDPIIKYVENCSSNIIRIVNKCLEKDPSNRYQTAKELLQELEMFQLDPDYGFNTTTIETKEPVIKKSLVRKFTITAVVIVAVISLSFLLPSGWEKIKNLF